MTQTHWKKLHNPDYLGAYSLDPGQDLILTIKNVTVQTVTGPDNRKEECPMISFVEPSKPMVLNVTNSKIIAKIYGTPFIEEWAGKKIQIYVDNVKAFGDVVEALRIRKFIPTSTTASAPELVCHDCARDIVEYNKLKPAQIAKGTIAKYGVMLCGECALVHKAALEAATNTTAQADAPQGEPEGIPGGVL